MSVRQAVTKLTLDMSLDTVQKSVAISKGDTNRRMEITLTDAGRPFTLPSTWTATLSGGQMEDGCMVERGRILYDLSSGALTAEAGIFELAFRIFDEEGDEVATPMITCNVYDVERNTAAVASTDEFSVLQDFIKNINDVDTRLDATEEDTKNLRETVDELDENVGGLRSDVQGLDRAMEETSGRVDSLGVWLGDLDNEVKDLDAYCTELEESVADLNLRISMHSFTIQPDQWSDVDPYQAYNSVYIANLGSRSATLLLVPLTPETRAEARKTELSVDYTYNSSGIITVWMTRTEYVPTITMYFAVVVVTSTKQVPGGYSYAASFVGVAELPDELMDKEVLSSIDRNLEAIAEKVLGQMPVYNGEVADA